MNNIITEAVNKNDLAFLKKAIKYGADINQKLPEDKAIPIYNAIMLGHNDIVKLFIKNGASLTDPTGYKGNHAVYAAAHHDNVEILALFMGSIPKTARMKTQLMKMALEGFSKKTLKFLLDQEFDPISDRKSILKSIEFSSKYQMHRDYLYMLNTHLKMLDCRLETVSLNDVANKVASSNNDNHDEIKPTRMRM